ncbi:hypothetical protein G4O51_08120 [Candidatus Bathyarchaeota archaeon A05DMB-2]|nr:hypothetical protein [Candidatus Bathyarchaeota archaeon A05DMB-2]
MDETTISKAPMPPSSLFDSKVTLNQPSNTPTMRESLSFSPKLQAIDHTQVKSKYKRYKPKIARRFQADTPAAKENG